MPKVLYFSGLIELKPKSVHYNMLNKRVGEPIDYEPIYITGEGWQHNYLPVNRIVRYHNVHLKHECDARCINASGHTMNCECACGGKNHGKGAFSCE